MKLGALILGELAIAGLLAVLLFVVLLYQPAWIWIAAPLIMLGGFVGIIAWAKSETSASPNAAAPARLHGLALGRGTVDTIGRLEGLSCRRRLLRRRRDFARRAPALAREASMRKSASENRSRV